MHGGGSIHVHRGRLFTDDDFEEIHVQKVTVDAGRNHATFDGWINTVKANDNINIGIEGCFLDLGVWLERFSCRDLPRARAAVRAARTVRVRPAGPVVA